MSIKLSFVGLALLLQLTSSFESSGQEVTFRDSTSGDSFYKFVQLVYEQDYIQKLSSLCSTRITLVKFNISDNGGIVNIKFSPTCPTYIKEFLNTCFYRTKGKWRTKNPEISIVLPFGFSFIHNCTQKKRDSNIKHLGRDFQSFTF